MSLIINVKIIFSVTECNVFQFNLYKIIEANNFYQISLFISEYSAKIINFKKSSFYETPIKIYSFNINYQNRQIFGNFSENALKNIYSLQESLVIFFTSDLNEIHSFIDFLILQLSVRQRPTCLIIYIKNYTSHYEFDVINILKCAWEKKFLNFLISMTDIDSSIEFSNFIFNYNPFNNIVYKRKLDKSIKVFPDKLKEAHMYPFYYARRNIEDDTTHVRKPFKKTKIFPENHFVIDFAARVLNLTPVVKKRMRPSFLSRFLYSEEFMKEWNLDVIAFRMFDKNYLASFLIPALDQRAFKVAAFVPMLPTSRVDLFSKFYIMS